jgi:hypothetical protein
MGGKVTGLTKTPPANAAAVIRKMASGGAAQTSIANALGTSEKTLRAWLKEHEALQAAYDEGREKERLVLHTSLLRRAKDLKSSTGMAAAAFLLKARHGYRENAPEETGNRLNIITFNLPSAMPVEQYVDAIRKISEPAK